MSRPLAKVWLKNTDKQPKYYPYPQPSITKKKEKNHKIVNTLPNSNAANLLKDKNTKYKK